MILYVLNGLWVGNDEFGMILVWNMNGWLVMNVGMELVCMIIYAWWVKHDFGVVYGVIP